METTHLYIGNLSPHTKEGMVAKLFIACGVSVTEVRLGIGFAYVKLDAKDAKVALKALDGKIIETRPLSVSRANLFDDLIMGKNETSSKEIYPVMRRRYKFGMRIRRTG